MPTILELFRGAGLDKQVKPDRLTGVEQELKGVRFKSAVEVNNPLIYGNEATRIALRSTPEKDKMIESKKPDGAPAQGEGGLLGKGLGKITKGKVNSVNQLRDKVNSALGVPQTLIPSSYINTEGLDDPNLGIQSGYEERLIKIKDNAKGSFVGGLLSGGTPKTIAQQAAGKALKEAKDLVRETLFSNSSAIKDKFGKKEKSKTTDAPEVTENTKGATYSEQALDNKLIDKDSSTTYIKYPTTEEELGKIRVGKGYVSKDGSGNRVEGREGIEPSGRNDKSFKESDERFSANNDYDLAGVKGFTNKDDVINQSGIYKGGTDKETAIKHELDTKDFIPLYFRNIVTGETVHFRGTITGLSESVTPSWDSAKFAGNPFSFYTYTGIERSVTFNFTIYPMNAAELANNWTKIEFLTSLTYPLGYQGGQIGAVRAPIVYFTMGDLYKDKESFIDSLQYTIPDNSNWQLDGNVKEPKDYQESGEFFSENGGTKVDVDKGYKLPHLIEVAITMKFIEQRANTQDRKKLYSFKSITY